VRFERSTLPEHNGTRKVVLRFLKIITPVKCVIPRYDGHIVQPEEGKLHRIYSYSRRDPQNSKETGPSAWSVDIDDPEGAMARGLQLLWDK
jgi:hypothetical protein